MFLLPGPPPDGQHPTSSAPPLPPPPPPFTLTSPRDTRQDHHEHHSPATVGFVDFAVPPPPLPTMLGPSDGNVASRSKSKRKPRKDADHQPNILHGTDQAPDNVKTGSTTLVGGATPMPYSVTLPLALRNRVLGRRVLILNERRHYAEQREHSIAAQRNYMALCSVLSTHDRPPDSLQQTIKEAWDEVQNCTHLLGLLEDKMEIAEKKLNALERRLRKKENLVYEYIRKLHSNPDDDESSTEDGLQGVDDDTAILSAWSASAASSDTPPMAKKYYSRIGDVNIYRERIYNFESEHQRQRKMRQDQDPFGEPPSPPESEFLRRYFEERAILIKDYSMAKNEVQTLKEECRQSGLEVEEPNFPPEEAGDSLDHSQIYTREAGLSATPSHISFVRHGVDNTDTSASDLQDGEPKTRISDWLTDLQRFRHAGNDHWEEVNPGGREHPPIGPLSPSSEQRRSQVFFVDHERHPMEPSWWTEQAAEVFLALPNYQQLSVMPRAASRSSGSRRSIWQGDPPKGGRRYSDPTL